MFKGTVSVFSSDPSCKICNARICLIKYELNIHVFVSIKTGLFFFHILSNGESIRFKHFTSQKNDGIFHIRLRFVNQAWPSLNYAYSPFKRYKSDEL